MVQCPKVSQKSLSLWRLSPDTHCMLLEDRASLILIYFSINCTWHVVYAQTVLEELRKKLP